MMARERRLPEGSCAAGTGPVSSFWGSGACAVVSSGTGVCVWVLSKREAVESPNSGSGFGAKAGLRISKMLWHFAHLIFEIRNSAFAPQTQPEFRDSDRKSTRLN